MTEQTEQASPNLLTVKQFAGRHAAFSVGSLRHMIFQCGNPAGSAHAQYAGMGAALVRIGGRVLIDEAEFFQWAKSQPTTP